MSIIYKESTIKEEGDKCNPKGGKQNSPPIKKIDLQDQYIIAVG